MGSEWNVGTKPPRDGYYLGAWRHKDVWMVSELWFHPDSAGTGWWPSREYLEWASGTMNNRWRITITVVAWMPMPEYPDPPEQKRVEIINDPPLETDPDWGGLIHWKPEDEP